MQTIEPTRDTQGGILAIILFVFILYVMYMLIKTFDGWVLMLLIFPALISGCALNEAIEAFKLKVREKKNELD
jgi:hypothetical protein